MKKLSAVFSSVAVIRVKLLSLSLSLSLFLGRARARKLFFRDRKRCYMGVRLGERVLVHARTRYINPTLKQKRCLR